VKGAQRAIAALGHEAIVEHAQWLIIRRTRKLDLHIGGCVSLKGVSGAKEVDEHRRGTRYPTVLDWSTRSRSGDTARKSASSFSIVGNESPHS
jgi:hypothetical protein